MKINNSQKGITMVTLTIAIIVLVIVSNILIYNAKDSVHTRKLENLYNDIQMLRDKVIEYSIEYGNIPADDKLEYSLDGKDDLKNNWMTNEEKQTGKFYVIDLKELDGLTLNYGRDYEKITESSTKEDINKLTDIYIVNNVSNNIFYVEGINVDGKKYYSDREKDETNVNLRYPQGIAFNLKAEASKNEVTMVQGNTEVKLDISNFTSENKEDFNQIDVEYQIGVEEADKFKIDTIDENENVIKGGNANTNEVTVNLSSIPNAILGETENINLVVKAVSPETKEVVIPIKVNLPEVATGYMNDFRPATVEDVAEEDKANIDLFTEFYGDNSSFEYDEDKGISLGNGKTIGVFDKQDRNYSNGYSVNLTVKGDIDQYPKPNADPWGPATILAMSKENPEKSNRLCWIGFRNGNLQVYSYYQGDLIENQNGEYYNPSEKPGYISKALDRKYNNQKMNIQIVGNNENTTIYINGELWTTFESGKGNGEFSQATIGDLRPLRGLMYTGNVYDIAIYNRELSENEVGQNWTYAQQTWGIKK